MKVCMIITGFLRTYLDSFYGIEKNILNRYDVDLYLATWDKDEKGNLVNKNFYNIYKDYNVKKVLVKDYDEYNKSKFIIKKINRENDLFDINTRAKEHGEYWANRLKDQWYLVKESFLSVEDLSKYDIVLRTRFDLFFDSILIKKINGITIPKDIGGWNFTDHMAYGDIDSMKKYCLLHDHIYDLYEKLNLDITHAVDMPKFYLENYEQPVFTFIDNNIRYTIRK